MKSRSIREPRSKVVWRKDSSFYFSRVEYTDFNEDNSGYSVNQEIVNRFDSDTIIFSYFCIRATNNAV